MFRKLLDNTKPNSLANKFRRKRFRLFKEFIKDMPLPVTILDLGGTENYWKQLGLVGEKEYLITVLNLSEPEYPKRENLTFIQGNALDLSSFGNNSFDVVFSNSVIEHIPEIKMRQKMADEAIRVGRSYFMQTPNYYFPFEPHFLFPCFQYFPEQIKIFILTHFNMGWFKKCADKNEAKRILNENRLLDKNELLSYFKGGKIVKEKFFLFTKSIIAAGYNT